VKILYWYISAFTSIFENMLQTFYPRFSNRQNEHKAANKCRLYKLNFPKLVDFFGSFPKLGNILTTETLTVLSQKKMAYTDAENLI
jgi:hypothetical protein